MGEHSRVTLPDGTALTLNAQTTVRYNLADGKRQVSIDGEAFFEVARDPEHPFVVSANGMTVTCLGTSFDVRNYSDESNISVVLRDGKVRVNACDADLTMEPGSRVLMDRQTLALSKHTVTPSDYTAWLNGEIKYNDQTLEEIAAELSRNYNIDLVITSDELKQERFTGYLGRSSLRNILDVLCLASDMSYHVDNDTMVYIYPRKKR
ncbi:MAG: FecR domain-containing protein [Paludibacteraceae bacterium]|nr:FecR domain-containing protein [Paludibacteraceae bacterium]